MKALCMADKRDTSLPCFNETELLLMKNFYKQKIKVHDLYFLLIENNVFLNVMRKMSKYLKNM